MKKQDIRRIYTQKVTELLAQGYTIYPDTMNGSQGEIAHIDLTDGNEIIRVLLEKAHACPDRYDDEDAYWGDVIRLTVGRAAPDTRVGSNWDGTIWDGTIWNSHLEPIFQIEWADVTGYRRNSEWYTDLEEGRRIQKLQRARSRNHRDFRNYTSIELGDAYKSAALRWVQKQPRMKTCRLEDIEKVTKVSRSDRVHYEITARGKTFRTDK